MQAMDVFVFPSIFEGLAVALIEAQASGLLVFASDKAMPTTAKMSEDFEFISLGKDAEEWAKIIINNLEEANERENRRNNIRKMGFDIKLEAKKLEENLRGL